jgi:hypothetical protein
MPLIDTEDVSRRTKNKIVFSYHDGTGKPIYRTKEYDLKKKVITLFPYSVSSRTGEVTAKKISRIDFIGWDSEDDLPKDLKYSRVYSFTGPRMKPLVTLLRTKFKKLTKIIIGLNVKTQLNSNQFIFKWDDLKKILRGIAKEKDSYDISRKLFILDSIAELSPLVPTRKKAITPGELSNFLSKFESFDTVSDKDVKAVTALIDSVPASKISVTGHFIQTREKFDTIYLEDLIREFETLLKVTTDNEEQWQKFFEQNSWLLTHLFPYQVILREGKAYVGGKTLGNDDGRIVDFLFQTGFKDNYALLEIKNHKKSLLKSSVYRNPDVYSLSDELSGGINQCLDQKDQFLRDSGQKYKSLDPPVILIIGLKSKLTSSQSTCFELIRSNQKNVDLVTFDELLSKLKVLHDVITGKKK